MVGMKLKSKTKIMPISFSLIYAVQFSHNVNLGRLDAQYDKAAKFVLKSVIL